MYKRSELNKKAVSAVVATVLIIMITVASVGIVWAVIIPMVRDNLGSSIVCNDADVSIGTSQGYTCYDSTQKVVSVQVVKGANDVSVSSVRIFASSSGSSFSYSTDFNFEKGSSKTFYLNVSNLASVDQVSLAPILTDGKKERECTKVVLNTIPSCNLGEVKEEILVQDGEKNEEGDTLLTTCQEISKSGTYVLQNDVSDHVGTCFTITVNNVTLNGNGYSIDGDDTDTDYGIFINGVSGVNVTGFGGITGFYNGVTDNYGGNYIISNTISSNTNVGISLSGTSGSTTVSGNIIESNSNDGIEITGGTHIIDASTSANIIRGNHGGVYIAIGIATISGNIIGENGYVQDKGIYDNTGGSTITDNTITYNTEGIYISGTSGSTTVSGNTIENNYHGIEISGGSHTISGNTIRGNAGSGIYIPGGTATISGNMIGESGMGNYYGIYDSYGGSTITSNTIAYNFANIYISSGSTIVSGNIIEFATGYFGIEIAGGYPVVDASTSANIIRAQTVGIYLSGGTATISGNIIGENGKENSFGIQDGYGGSTITSNTITYNNKGIYLSGTNGVTTVSGNMIDRGTTGIEIAGGNHMIDNSVSANIIGSVNGFLYGIYLSGGTATISGNEISNCGNMYDPEGGIYDSYGGSTIVSNTLSNNPMNGIYLSGTNGVTTVSGNTIGGNNKGIQIAGGSGNRISGNTLTSYYDTAVLFSAASESNVIGLNTINSGISGCGDPTYSCSGIAYASTSNNDEISENDINAYGHGVYYYSEAPSSNPFIGVANTIVVGGLYYNVSLMGEQYNP